MDWVRSSEGRGSTVLTIRYKIWGAQAGMLIAVATLRWRCGWSTFFPLPSRLLGEARRSRRWRRRSGLVGHVRSGSTASFPPQQIAAVIPVTYHPSGQGAPLSRRSAAEIHRWSSSVTLRSTIVQCCLWTKPGHGSPDHGSFRPSRGSQTKVGQTQPGHGSADHGSFSPAVRMGAGHFYTPPAGKTVNPYWLARRVPPPITRHPPAKSEPACSGGF